MVNKLYSIVALGIVLSTILFSCSITKRVHRPGYHIHWKNQAQNIDSRSEYDTNEEKFDAKTEDHIQSIKISPSSRISVDEQQIETKISDLPTEPNTPEYIVNIAPPDSTLTGSQENKDPKEFSLPVDDYEAMHAVIYSFGSIFMTLFGIIFLIILFVSGEGIWGTFFLIFAVIAFLMGLAALSFTKGENRKYRKYALFGLAISFISIFLFFKLKK